LVSLRAFLKEEKSSMGGVRLTLNECHRNWRFYKLWLLIGLSFAILAIMAATGKRGDDPRVLLPSPAGIAQWILLFNQRMSKFGTSDAHFVHFVALFRDEMEPFLLPCVSTKTNSARLLKAVSRLWTEVSRNEC
jgi:hypothetical protein